MIIREYPFISLFRACAESLASETEMTHEQDSHPQ